MRQLLIPVLFLAAAGISGCNDDNNNTETSISARADSIVGTRIPQITQDAMDDLDKRMTIEVKAKADSIVAFRMGKGRGSNDSTAVTPRVPDEEIIKKTKLPNASDSAR